MGLEVVLGGGALVCPSFASPAHTRDNMVRSAVVQLSTQCRTPRK